MHQLHNKKIVKINNRMNKKRCAWCGNDELYQNYHDEEWGKPIFDDETIFEFLVFAANGKSKQKFEVATLMRPILQ